MASAYEWLIGTRHLRSTHRRGFVSFVALISVLGLMLGVAVLIVVLSVMNGFERELRTRILSVTAHATLMGVSGKLADWRAAQKIAEARPDVLAAAPYIEAQGLLVNGRHVKGIAVRGVLPEQEARTTGLGQRLTAGKLADLQAGRFNIIVGAALAKELRLHVGDTVIMMVPEGTATPIGVMPRSKTFHVTGIFESGMFEFDNTLALIHMTDAAKLYRFGDEVTGIRLAVRDLMRAPSIVRQVALAQEGGSEYYVSDWTGTHVNFFRAIQTTKTMMFIILLMIVAVAAFNIVSTLVMIVKEKQSDIAILRTLGAGPRNILGVFAIQGITIGLAGTALGAGLGVLVSNNVESLVRGLEWLAGTHFLDASVYFMSDLPAYVEGVDVLQVCSVAFLLCAVATLYPAWRASRTQPAEALRHD
ncbi:MAG TPA: lipoprotein-releasing ABC transporter permease subunit [Steroidobacteraceae bacterium]|jgi:lipoprotein-releasing system permease protein